MRDRRQDWASIVGDTVTVLTKHAPAGVHVGWVLDGEDEDGEPLRTAEYRAFEAVPEVAFSLGWLQGAGEALDLTRLELLDEAQVDVHERVEGEPVRKTLSAAEAVVGIHALLDGTHWTADTTAAIAGIVRAAGFVVRDVV